MTNQITQLKSKLDIANRMLQRINTKIEVFPGSGGVPPVVFMDDELAEEFTNCLNLLNGKGEKQTLDEAVFAKYSWHHKQPKTIYRLESITKENGLWYDSTGKLVFGIGKLEDCETKNLPMDYDSRYHVDGFSWWSACSRINDLSHWYSLKNAEDLIANGFVFTEYTVVDYIEYEFETVFLKETALDRKEIDIKSVFPTMAQ